MAKAASTIKKVTKIAQKKTVVKKAASKTITAKKKDPSINIKYEDKSKGQPEMIAIFGAIKKLCQPYANKGALKLYASTGGQLNMVSHKEVVIAGRKRSEIWFISALVQKGYVGFYYMPLYMNDPMKSQFSPEFMKCLKGKACFHIRENDSLIMADIKKAIKLGYEAYKERGWV